MDHDDYYILVGHDVLVVSLTSNGQMICQFCRFLVMDDAVITTMFSCTWLFIFVFLCCCIKVGTLSLVREGEHIANHLTAVVLLSTISVQTSSTHRLSEEQASETPSTCVLAWVGG